MTTLQIEQWDRVCGELRREVLKFRDAAENGNVVFVAAFLQDIDRSLMQLEYRLDCERRLERERVGGQRVLSVTEHNAFPGGRWS